MVQGEQAEGQGAEQLTVVQAIDNLICPDTGLRFYAAWWLGRFKVQDALGFERLIAALGDEDDRTEDGGYPLRRNAARALGKIGAGWSVGESAVLPLIQCLDCSDFYVREAAAQSLELLLRRGSATEGESSVTERGWAIEKLVERLKIGLEGEALKAGADLVEPFDAYLEALGTLGAQETIGLIQPFLAHPIGRTQYAADRAMYQLTGDDRYGQLLIEALNGADLQLRRAALTDVGAIGYLPAAEAIAETLAENSLKLIALKGVLEAQVGASGRSANAGLTPTPVQAEGKIALSPGAIRVMNLMDRLL